MRKSTCSPVSKIGEIDMVRKLWNNVTLNLQFFSLFLLYMFCFRTVQAELIAYWSMDEFEGRRVVRNTVSGRVGTGRYVSWGSESSIGMVRQRDLS